MLNRFHQKIGCILGLLAILLVTLAPTISHALAGHEQAAALSASICSAQSAPDDTPGNQDASHSLTAHWQTCGYCSLLAHMPVVLPGAQSAFAVAVWVIQHKAATTFESVRLAEPVTFTQPRAPPISS
ncbi:DUF2946 domain-containing protein [Trinickia fusca]|uniref:DUF2946 domain-containing protein n=1 Tax=Trinickia fusca TaxID=2419777 RepID=A0A494XG23_9BURK|nr:DUF2946 domain-containing protein [Trinickia fusca]RKP49478.1 DUF2946 domain-containing protein [Trinickia fusca]